MGKKADRKVSFAAALRKSLVRNLKIQAALRDQTPSSYVEQLLMDAIPKSYEFVKDDGIYSLPYLRGTKEKVLKVWVEQLERKDLSFEGGMLICGARSVDVEGLEDEVTIEGSLELKELLYNLIHPKGVSQGGLLEEDDIRRVAEVLEIEGHFEVLTDPQGLFFFVVPDRGCSLKRVVEIDRRLDLGEAEALIREKLEER